METIQNRPRSGRENNFDVIRHAAAIAVVLTHSYYVATGKFSEEPLVDQLDHSIGNYAVDVFFLLSGFLLAQSISKNGDLLRFAVSTALRIGPALVVVVLATSLVLGPLVSDLSPYEYFSGPRVLSYVLGAGSTLYTSNPLPGVFDGLPVATLVNVPLWTIKYEILAYVTLAAVVLLGRWTGGRSWVPLFAACAAFYAIGRIALPWPGTHASILSNVLHFFLYFYLGASAYVLRRKLPLSLLGLLVLILCAASTHRTQAREFYEALAVGYGVLWLAFLPRPSWLRTSFKADYSYGLYLFSFPIQQTLRQVWPSVEPLQLFVISLLATLPFAALSWHLVERRALACRPRVFAWISSLLPSRLSEKWFTTFRIML